MVRQLLRSSKVQLDAPSSYSLHGLGKRAVLTCIILFKETLPPATITPLAIFRPPFERPDFQQEKEVKEVICIDDSYSKDVSHPPPQNATPSHSHR